MNKIFTCCVKTKIFRFPENYVWLILATLLFSGCSTQTEKELPNIIFLLTDDQRDNTFSITGHPYIKTPNIDKLISEGVRFSNTYIAEPVCSPSRVSIFTGMHERIHGVGFSSSFQLTEEQWDQSYPAILRRNGYYTGFVGKFGVEYYTFKGKTPEKFDYWYGHDGWTRFFPKEHDTPSCTPYHDAENDMITPIMGEGINRFLDSVPEKMPFCLSVSFNVPHGSQTTSMYTGYDEWHSMTVAANENPKLKGHPIYDTLYRGRNIRIPEDMGTDPYRFIPSFILDQDKGRNKTYDYDYTPETCLEHHIRYYQTITGLDSIIGNMIKSLKERGLDKNTVIIYASDNGLIMGEYGMGGKALLYDLSSKIPCFVYDPRLQEGAKGKTVERLVSSLDIPVTILDYAGIQPPVEMSGKSLVPLVKGEKVPWREELFLESLFTLRDNPFCEGIRTGKWKYIRMYDGVNRYKEKDIDFEGRTPEFEQLFDLSADPGERVNLIGEYENTTLLDSLRQKVKDYSVDINKKRQEYMKTHVLQNR